jgi:hypothetical protein
LTVRLLFVVEKVADFPGRTLRYRYGPKPTFQRPYHTLQV